jgi:predicted nucleic acid-binding protein
LDYLIDTNVLLRALATANPHKAAARNAIRKLLQNGKELCAAPQNLIEFWSVCTRPEKQNGLGKTVAVTDRYCRFAESFLTILSEGPDLFKIWRTIVVDYEVSGKQVHDARIVATMKLHGVRRLLTFDTDDFARYKEIEVIDPRTI